MIELTKAEEQVMQILWKIEKGFIKDIIEHYDDPKPAYTTVSTILKILLEKNFVDRKPYGNTHAYFPLITKDQYSKKFLNKFVHNYFANSYRNFMSFFSKQEDLSTQEMQDIIDLLQEEIKKQNKQ